MQTIFVTVVGVAVLACAITRVPDRFKPAWSRGLKWWQTLIGLLAIILAILILINPEFLAMGFVGDAAFFDLLVLFISFQIQTVGLRVWRCLMAAYSRTIRQIVVPQMLLTCRLLVWAFAGIGGLLSAIQKLVHRISS